MLVIADSGSSKTHWRIIDSQRKVIGFETVGLNPYHIKPNDFYVAISKAFPDAIKPEQVLKVHYYGAGCAAKENQSLVAKYLVDFFTNAQVEVDTDILAAARALFGNKSGLVAILGTGANAGFYNGFTVEHQTPTLGYILGDEGSGAYLGKELLKRWLYGEFPADLAKELSEFSGLNRNELISRVYFQPNTASFLASFVPFVIKHIHQPDILGLVDSAFHDFVLKHLLKYAAFSHQPIGVVGSVGYLLRERLNAVLASYGAKLTFSLRHPIDKLVEYHKV